MNLIAFKVIIPLPVLPYSTPNFTILQELSPQKCKSGYAIPPLKNIQWHSTVNSRPQTTAPLSLHNEPPIHFTL